MNPAVAPQGADLSKQRLEASFCAGVSWRKLPGVPDDLRGYPPGELKEAVDYFLARHPRCGQVTLFR